MPGTEDSSRPMTKERLEEIEVLTEDGRQVTNRWRSQAFELVAEVRRRGERIERLKARVKHLLATYVVRENDDA